MLCHFVRREFKFRYNYLVMFHTLDMAEAKVNRIVDALTASENESFNSSGNA